MLLTGITCVLGAIAAGTVAASAPPDWLLSPPHTTSRVLVNAASHEISLDNGLLRRTFRIAPNFGTVGYKNLTTGVELIRSVKPEATIEMGGKRYEVGGLKGQPEHAYIEPAWLDSMSTDPGAFQFDGYTTGIPVARFAWKQVRYHNSNLAWPPHGVSLTIKFRPPDAVRATYPGLIVSVSYELYDGIPALCKWISIHNGSPHSITIDRFENEILALVEEEPCVETWIGNRKPPIHIQSDYAFCGGTIASSDQTTHWDPDPEFTSQINYELKAPVTLVSRPPIGPDAMVSPGESFDTFHTFELLYGGDDRERRGLELRRFQQTIAPWTSENPIIMHLRYSDSKSIRSAVDQCAAVGFEMIILTFGSGFEPDSQDPAYIARMKADVDYAHSKGIEIGGYTLTGSRDAGPGNNVVANNVVNPKTGKKGAVFGQSPCLASSWSDGYYSRMLSFIQSTGIDIIEDDGSYPGDLCESTAHAHHRGLDDSQWNQWRTITGFYQKLRASGVYINAPDYYFLAGSNKCAMGYRETNWSLPRDRQVILGRQNIFDGTWEKTSSMGWMFVPLVEYQGGGAAATLEPLAEHLDAYEAHLAQNFASGVQACYRGPRLYDTEKTKVVVKKWVDFYKKHRQILDSDIIHVRRPDGRDLDCILHVNPNLPERGLAVIYNPTDSPIKSTMKLPLYYTGLRKAAILTERDGTKRKALNLDRGYNIEVAVTVPAHGLTWYVITE